MVNSVIELGDQNLPKIKRDCKEIWQSGGGHTSIYLVYKLPSYGAKDLVAKHQLASCVQRLGYPLHLSLERVQRSGRSINTKPV